MSFFSRVTFQAHNRDELKQLYCLRNQPYAQHRALWRFFDRPFGTEQPFLFREMAEDSLHSLRFFLVSDEPPLAVGNSWHVESKSYEPKLHVGESFHFRVRLNPTRSERVSGKRGKRQDLVMSRLHELKVPREQRAAERQRIVHEELPQWLRLRGESRGFEIDYCVVDCYEVRRLYKAEREITLSVADLSGRLRVTDAGALGKVLQGGFGHGRSFGLGLLLLKSTGSADEA